MFLPDRLTRISNAFDGGEADGNSFTPAMGGGRFVVFTSEATNLVEDDTNGVADIFAHDLMTGTTERLGEGLGGTETNGPAGTADISGDGRYVVFSSDATNLVEGDTNGVADIFLLDRATGEIERVSETPEGEQIAKAAREPVISGDASAVAFESGDIALPDADVTVFHYDIATGETTDVATPIGDVEFRGGKAVGARGPSISDDGRRVGFTSFVEIETDYWPELERLATVWDATTGERVSPYFGSNIDIRGDGRFLSFVYGDWPNSAAYYDFGAAELDGVPIYLPDHDRADFGNNSEAVLSADGRYIAVESDFVHREPEGSSYGRYAIGVWDRIDDEGTTISAQPDGRYADGSAFSPDFGADGALIAYYSSATDMIPDVTDTNDAFDIFVAANPVWETVQIRLSYLDDAVEGGATSDLYDGRDGDDDLSGGGGNDWLAGGAGADTLDGGEGFDWLTPGAGADSVAGGTGIDAVSYVDLGQRVVIDLAVGTAVSDGETDLLSGIENATGSIYSDAITGDAGDNTLRGLGGYDWFTATGGADLYKGGSGKDTVSYVAAEAAVSVSLAEGRGLSGLAEGDSYVSVERITGSIFSDTLIGDDGENGFRGLGGYDTFIGSGGGRDRYDGGSESDTVAYLNSEAGVTASLLLGYGSAGDAALDLYTSIENLGGTAFADALTGDHQGNNLRGLGGDDLIFGNGGTDRIYGGRGDDQINGGDGSDYILFDGASDSYEITRTGTRDAIVEWVGSGGGDGRDSLFDVEYLVFSDQTLDIWSL